MADTETENLTADNPEKDRVWRILPGCSRRTPHDENRGTDTEWQDDEMNDEHYNAHPNNPIP